MSAVIGEAQIDVAENVHDADGMFAQYGDMPFTQWRFEPAIDGYGNRSVWCVGAEMGIYRSGGSVSQRASACIDAFQ